MPSQNVVALAVHFVRDFPRMDSNRRAPAAIERDTEDFCVMKIGPVAKPVEERVCPLDLRGPLRASSAHYFLRAFDGEGDGVTAAEAESGDAALEVAALQFVEQRHQYSRA